MAFLFTGLCSNFCRRVRRRFDSGQFANGWKKLVRRFLHCSAAATDVGGRVKLVVLNWRCDVIGDGEDIKVAEAFSDEGDAGEDELSGYMFATGLIRMQSRVLFTIMEESKEDMDSDYGRSSRGERSRRPSITRSQSENGSCSSRRMFDFSPPSPPSRFKFLRDADEKFRTRLKKEAEERALSFHLPSQLELSARDNSSLNITDVIKDSDTVSQIVQNQPPFSSSKVIPLESSPPY